MDLLNVAVSADKGISISERAPEPVLKNRANACFLTNLLLEEHEALCWAGLAEAISRITLLETVVESFQKDPSTENYLAYVHDNVIDFLRASADFSHFVYLFDLTSEVLIPDEELSSWDHDHNVLCDRYDVVMEIIDSHLPKSL